VLPTGGEDVFGPDDVGPMVIPPPTPVTRFGRDVEDDVAALGGRRDRGRVAEVAADLFDAESF
jgi:hypothetical protein